MAPERPWVIGSMYYMNISTKRIICVVFISCFFILPAKVVAELYQWQDEKGGIHVVDDILLVPPKYKDTVKIFKTKPSEHIPSREENITQPQEPSQYPSSQEELYGDYPLSWWENEFRSRKNEISALEKIVEQKKAFMADYERGRWLYKIYTKEDSEKYEAYKKELPDNEAKLNQLKADLDEFRHKAQTYGVPRAIRE